MYISSLRQQVTRVRQLYYNGDKYNCSFGEQNNNWGYDDVANNAKKN
jgi:hypothetical protein